MSQAKAVGRALITPQAARVVACLVWLACLWGASVASAAPMDNLQRWRHDSGATVMLAEKHDLPYVSMQITLRSGALWDPAGRSGLSRFVAELMTRGAADRSRADIEDTLERLGSGITIDAEQDSVHIELDSLSRNLDAVVAVLADVLQHPSFPPDELAKLQRERASDILRVRDNDRQLNRRFFRRSLYAGHPYGRPADGTLEGIAAITLEDARAFYKAHFVAGNLILGFAGDLTRAQADALAGRLVGELPSGAAPALDLPGLPAAKGRQVILVDKPDRTQNQILIGHLVPTAAAEDALAMELVNTLFGGTFTARLNQEVRDKRGLAYGAYSAIHADRHVGAFSIWTFPASTDGVKTLRLLIELYEGLKARPLSAEEIEFGRQYLINAFAFLIDTPAKLLREAINAELEGLPADHLDTYVGRVKALTDEEVNAAIEAHFDPANFHLVMLCTAAGFEEPVRALPGVTTVRVVAYDERF